MKDIKTILRSLCLAAGLPAAALGHASMPDAALATDLRLHSCNGCSLTQAANQANALGQGNHYFYNLSGNILYLFSVECEPVGGGSQCDAGSIPPAADKAAYFSNYHMRWLANGQSESFVEQLRYDKIVAPSSTDNGFVNAYDTLSAGFLLLPLLNDFLGNAQNHREDLRNDVQLLLNGQPVAQQETITVVVTFNDGSTRKFKVDPTTHSFAPIANTAVDSNGNPIPEQRPTSNTRYTFGTGPTQRYNARNIATILLVPPPQLYDTVVCTFDVGPNRLTCPAPQ